MDAAAIASILGIAGTLVTLAEKYGPGVYEELVSAFDSIGSKSGPTVAQMQALQAKIDATDDAIQASK